jgi:hypothetical protein
MVQSEEILSMVPYGMTMLNIELKKKISNPVTVSLLLIMEKSIKPLKSLPFVTALFLTLSVSQSVKLKLQKHLLQLQDVF